MTSPEPSEPDDRGTWLEGRDILPANIPPAVPPKEPDAAPPAAEPASGRRTRPWSLIAGLPLVAIICFGAGAVLGARHGAGTSAELRTATSVGGDPLLSARVDSVPTLPSAPVRYLEAQAQGDGQAAWNLLSAGAQQQLSQQGGSAAALTQELKQHPFPTVKQITFVGGATLSDGREATIFVVTADVNGALQQVPYYFTVDTQGKIDEVH